MFVFYLSLSDSCISLISFSLDTLLTHKLLGDFKLNFCVIIQRYCCDYVFSILCEITYLIDQVLWCHMVLPGVIELIIFFSMFLDSTIGMVSNIQVYVPLLCDVLTPNNWFRVHISNPCHLFVSQTAFTQHNHPSTHLRAHRSGRLHVWPCPSRHICVTCGGVHYTSWAPHVSLHGV